jgi:hypothetical protein
MLTSSTVSPNIIPGVAKALENYIIIYRTDDLLRATNSAVKNVFKIAGGTIQALSNNRLVLKEGPEQTPAQNPWGVPGPRGVKVLPPKTPQQTGQTAGGRGATTKAEKAKVDFPRHNAITLEPTWIKVETERKGLQLLGVKVIPFPVSSGGNIVDAIRVDAQRKLMNRRMIAMYRAVIRTMWRLARFARLPEIGEKALTGDPTKDIIFASTMYKHNVFLCLSQMEVEDENFLSDTRTVRDLFKMGWNSFIIADDMNKRATFCMKEFRGICSTVNYQFLYSALGKDQYKVYEDLEDARRSASPFFRQKISLNRVVGEMKASNKVQEMEEISEAQELVNEDLKTLIKRMQPDRLLRKIKNLKNATTPQDIQTALSGIPAVSLDKVEEFARRVSNDYKSNKRFAQRVIKNSTRLNDSIVEKSSIIIACLSGVKGKDSREETKENLKSFVKNIRASKFNRGELTVGSILVPIFTATAAGAGIHFGIAIATSPTTAQFIAGVVSTLAAVPMTYWIIVGIVLALILLLIASRDA